VATPCQSHGSYQTDIPRLEYFVSRSERLMQGLRCLVPVRGGFLHTNWRWCILGLDQLLQHF